MPGSPVSPAVDRAAAYAWRLIVIAVAVVGLLWLLGQLRLVLFPIIVAVFLIRALTPLAVRLRRRMPNGIAAALSLLTFLALVGLTVGLIVPAVADEFGSLGPTVAEAVDDIERWLVEDSGLDISRADIERGRDQLSERIRSGVRASGGAIAEGAVVVAEGLAGLVIALFLTFFGLKDGDRFARWAEGWLPQDRRPRARRIAGRCWEVIGGYLRGAAILGLVEGAVMATAVALVGGRLALPVAILTFVSAFVPFVGAIVAGVIAVLVALASAGLTGAAIVAVVAFVVQQLDNDLLAPVVYGRTLQLHPAAIILSVAAGGALFGLPGTFLAVPVAAVVGAIGSELRSKPEADDDGDAELAAPGRRRGTGNTG
jgi:putative heme transporter